MDHSTLKTKFRHLLATHPGCTAGDKWLDDSVDFFIEKVDHYAYGHPRLLTLPMAKAIFDRDEEYRDFVYIKPWGVVFFDVTAMTSHEIFLAGLWAFFNKCKTGGEWKGRYIYDMATKDYGFGDGKFKGRQSISDNAERFLIDHYGFYASSAYCSSGLKVSESYPKTAQEKMIFKAFTWHEIVD